MYGLNEVAFLRGVKRAKGWWLHAHICIGLSKPRAFGRAECVRSTLVAKNIQNKFYDYFGEIRL